MPRSVGCLSPTQSTGRLVFADAEGFGFLDLMSGEINRIAEPEGNLYGNRFNDGKVDRKGRFWAGTIDDLCLKATGSLYRLDSDGRIQRMAKGLSALTASDGARMIGRFTFRLHGPHHLGLRLQLSTGGLGERRVFARLSDDDWCARRL